MVLNQDLNGFICCLNTWYSPDKAQNLLYGYFRKYMKALNDQFNASECSGVFLCY